MQGKCVSSELALHPENRMLFKALVFLDNFCFLDTSCFTWFEWSLKLWLKTGFSCHNTVEKAHSIYTRVSTGPSSLSPLYLHQE